MRRRKTMRRRRKLIMIMGSREETGVVREGVG